MAEGLRDCYVISRLQESEGSFLNQGMKTYVSLLGLTFPFEVLSADEDKMKKTTNAIEQAFDYEVGGVSRYPGDSYHEGNPWILSVLWLSIYYEELGDINRANRLIDWATSKSTDLYLLAEQVEKNSGVPVSAVPLAWSHAFFIISVMGLNDLVFPKHQNAPQDKSRSKLMSG